MNALDMAVLLFVLTLPQGLAVLLAFRRARPVALALAPWAGLPALVVAVAGWPRGTFEIEWILLGASFGIDAMSRIFLLLTAALWLAGGLAASGYHRADPKRTRLFAFYLVTLAGNLGLVLAGDVISFYLFFIVMSFAGFGLIIHAGTPEARRASIVYLVLVIVSEALLLPGLWLAVAGADSLSLADVAANLADADGMAMLLLAAGFGVKVAVLPLHVWLPLAYPVVPAPMSAPFSGAMIKAGVLGWIHFLPVGLGSYPNLALLFIVGGLTAVFYGAGVGIVQRKARAVLAYSSISQMGFLTAAVGVGLSGPQAWPFAAASIAVYALHHALAKGALFLGAGVVENAAGLRRRRLALFLLFFPALALAGVPLTSGFVAKTALKQTVHELPAAWHAGLDLLLALGAFGTTVLMARFLYVLARTQSQADRRGLWPPWLGLLAAGIGLGLAPGALPFPADLDSTALKGGPAAWWSALWPPALGIAAVVGVLWLQRRGAARRHPWLRLPTIRAGDILWLFIRAGRALGHVLPRLSAGIVNRLRGAAVARRNRSGRAVLGLLARAEGTLMRWPIVGMNVLITVLVVFLMLAWG
jgi:formate hydrogenlyase subunit 3/multisubunit Na+/H+ antiporter MnhD subunit